MRGYVTKKNNKYYPVIYQGTDINGKRKYKWGKSFEKERDADKELAKMVSEHNRNNLIFSDATVEQLAYQWFEMYAKESYSYRTLERYKGILFSFIVPLMGNAKLEKLQTMHIQRYLHTLEDRSPATKKKHYYVFKSMLDQAVKWNMIAKNPCEGVVLPKEKRNEMKVWEKETVNEFLNLVRGTKWHTPFMIAFTTGLRQGEIAGLKWQDFNKEDGTLHIVRSMQRNWELKDTKTRSSRRKIVLLENTIKVLAWQQEWQEENKSTFDEYEDTGFICTHENGQPINPENMGKWFNKVVERNNLPSIRFHDIRHTFATLLLKNGTNPKIVSEILGHNNVQTTLNEYSHVLPDMQQETMKKLQGTLFE